MNGESTGLLAGIVRFSLRFRGVVIALACVLLGYGLYALEQANYDVFPEFAPPQVVIQTEAQGLSAEQVEVLVTQPIENTINGVAGIERLSSNSIQGLSAITVIFKSNSDIFRNRQVVAERLATLAGQLPLGVSTPVISPLTSAMSVVLDIGLTSEQRSLMELRTLADWILKPRLLATPGVAKVAVFGGEVKELQVQVQPDRLIQYGLSIEDVRAATSRATGIRGAGFIDSTNQRLVLQSEGQFITAEQLAKTVIVHGNGANVTLGDIARVREAPEPMIGAASIIGQTGVQLVVSEQYGANTLKVTERIEQALQEIEPSLKQQGVTMRILFRPANFIQLATRNVQSSLLIGAALVVVVLSLFLFNLRTAAISCTAIPLSLLSAVIVLEWLGFSLNTMTLGGLAIAIGEVVDDAVIDVENILRRLRENRTAPNPQSPFHVVLAASIEVRSAVVYATFAVVLVFTPILMMSDLAGRLFAPLGIAYILSVLASLAVALTLTPALCLLFLGEKDLDEREPPLMNWLKRRYVGILTKVDRYPKVIIGSVALLMLTALGSLPFLGAGFLPDMKEGHFIVHVSAAPGTSLEESLRFGRQISQALQKLPVVISVAQRVGRAEKADDTWGTQYSEMDVDLKPLSGEASEQALVDIRRVLAEFPGVNSSVKTFLAERVEETLSGYTASVVVNVVGNNLDSLDTQARQIAQVLNQVKGATDVQVQSPPGTPRLVVRLRQDSLLRWGFDSVQVLEAIRTAYQGDVVSQIYEGNRIFNVAVILDPQLRKNIADIGHLPLRSPNGVYVLLKELADIYEDSGRYVVMHRGARRVQAVTCNVSGRDIASFVKEAKQRIAAGVALPTGSYLEFGGAAEAQAKSTRDLMIHSAIAGVGIVLLLSIVMGNCRNLLLVMINLPFALVGGVLAVFLSGSELTIGSLVGFVTLFGITLRNSVMLLSHYEHLVSVEGLTWNRETALRGAQERLTPILMTALVTVLGLLPLAIGSGEPGREIEGPMAIVILGGLATSTLLNLLVLPGLALRHGQFRADS
ncbi:efflux RND transporter permease subunit [Methylobacter sp. G7]|uniref:efflux RND transporter permease subunit n=1 Tax=Methylobacter sp. G7 TaxID=3230117 RepID=UPI003D8002E5